jgi:hypothetical protein
LVLAHDNLIIQRSVDDTNIFDLFRLALEPSAVMPALSDKIGNLKNGFITIFKANKAVRHLTPIRGDTTFGLSAALIRCGVI